MTRYASKIRSNENVLIVEGYDTIDAFLTILEKRTAEAYYYTNTENERDVLRKKMNAIDIVRRELGNIMAEKKPEAKPIS